MVKWVKIGDTCKVLRGKRLTKSQLTEVGEYPVLHGGLSPMGYYPDFNRKANTTIVVNTGNAGCVYFYDKKFWSSDACFSLYPSDCLLDKFLYHSLVLRENELKGKIRAGAMPTIDSLAVESIEIPLPPLSEQQRIVDILDKFEGMVENVEKELLLRQKQYEVYREKIIFSIPIIRKVCKLSEIAEICTGSYNTCDGINDGKYLFYTRGQEVLTMNEYEFDDKSIITSGDGVGVGKVFHLTNGKYALHQRAYRIHITDKKVSTKYVYNYFITCFYDYICMKSFFASVSSLRKPMLLDFEIPLPYLDKQQEIVAKLDKFEEMISTLKKELELRKKQYEYYREKLLTFE